jgi:hypothetical protein
MPPLGPSIGPVPDERVEVGERAPTDHMAMIIRPPS